MLPLLRTLFAATDATPRLALALQQGGFEIEAALADTPDALAAALAARPWDVLVVVDAEVPASAVLSAVRASQLALPVVVVSDTAADAFPGAASVVSSSALDELGAILVRLHDADSPLPPATRRMPLDPAAADTPALQSSDASVVQALAEHLPIGLYQSTPDGRILFANEALASVLGCRSFQEMLALDVRQDLGYPRDLFVEQIRRFGEVRNLIVDWTTRSGEARVTRENARAVRGEDGEVLYYEGTMEDITAEHTARERERRRNAQLAAIVRFATAVDEAATVEDVHRAAVDAVSVSMETPFVMLMARRGDETRCVAASEAMPVEAIDVFHTMNIGALLPLHTQPVLLRDEQNSRRVELPDEVRVAMRRHNTRAVGSFPLIHHGRAHGAFIVLYTDPHSFTDEELQVAETLAWHIAGSLARHRAESSLRDSEACLRFIAENTAHVLYRLRYETNSFDYLSPAVEDLTGYSFDELEALGGLSALVEEREVIQGKGLMQGPQSPGDESHYMAVYRMRTHAGESRYVENNAYLWYDTAGQAVGLVGVLQDVTERKLREDEQAAEAARSLAQQKALVELASLEDPDPDAIVRRGAEIVAALTGTALAGVWLADEDARTMVCHTLYDATADQHRSEAPRPLGPFRPLLAELERHRSLGMETLADPMIERMGAADYFAGHGVGAMLAAAVRRHGRVVGTVSLLHVDGDRAWTQAEQDFAAAVADVIALALERADRHAAEAARLESDGRYRAISELASDYAFAVYVHPDGRNEIAWATDAFRRVTGYAAEEIDGLGGLLAIVHAESAPLAEEAFRTLGDDRDLDLELRIVTKDGEERWVRHRARHVRDTHGRIVLYNSGQDVTEHKRFEGELIAAREAAEEMARLKSAFLANMSHEIRTPLTGILGYAGLLAEEVEGEHREFVQFIERSGRRLLDTLNSVLELARLEASGVEPELEVLDVAAEAEQAVRLLMPLAEQRRLAFDLHVPSEAARVRLDRTCFGRILTNLIGNAIKFTDEGQVSVDVLVEPADVVIRVRDTGVGIDPAFLPFLFDEFRQETAGQDRSHEGSGLGLAITKRLVELMGGRIDVESRRPGGTTFTVAFPRLAAAHVPAASGDGAGHRDDTATPILRADRSDAIEAATRTADTLSQLDDLLATPDVTPDDLEDSLMNDPAAPAPHAADGFFGARFDDEDPVDDTGFDDAFFHEAEDAPAVLDASELLHFPADGDDDDDDFDASFLSFEELPSLSDDADEPEAPAFTPDDDPVAAYETDEAAPAWDEAPAWDDAPVEEDAVASSAAWSISELVPQDESDGAHRAAPAGSLFQPAALTEEPPAPASDPTLAEAETPEPDTAEPDTAEPEMSEPAASELGVRHEASGDGMSAGASAVGDGRPAILVVEDNDDTRMLLDRILQRAYHVQAVGDARTALDLMARQRFDALVLDINLGGKQTGVDVLRVAKSIPGYENVFAIALTAYALPGDRERFLEAGFDRYVSKPFTRSTLMAALTDGVPVDA